MDRIRFFLGVTLEEEDRDDGRKGVVKVSIDHSKLLKKYYMYQYKYFGICYFISLLKGIRRFKERNCLVSFDFLFAPLNFFMYASLKYHVHIYMLNLSKCVFSFLRCMF